MTATIYFEDITQGQRRYFGHYYLTAAEMIAFARRYDPQFFHLDAKAAASGPFGGLIASGWHTSAIMMRLYAEYQCRPWANFGSPGFDDLTWHLPVRPGDRLSLRTEIKDKRRSASKPDRGVIFVEITVLNQRRQAVMSVLSKAMVACRNGTAT